MNIRYTIDATDTITEIEGPWDIFAVAGGAAELTREGVLGTSIFEYVHGAEVAEVVRLLLGRARGGIPVSLQFRCDAPSLRRYLRLEMRLLPGGAVRCETVVERLEERAVEPLLGSTATRDANLVVICSWCNKLKLPGERWVEVEEAVANLKLFLKPTLPQVSHGICDDCMAVVRSYASAPSEHPAPSI